MPDLDDYFPDGQDEASNAESDSRTAQAIAEQPFTAEKLGDLCQSYYGWRPTPEYLQIWFWEYCEENYNGPGITPDEFVQQLMLNDK
jgi:hypothetical protein